MTKSNSIKTIVIVAVVAVAVVIIGFALMATSKTQEQQSQAVQSTNNLIGKPLPGIALTDKDGKTVDLANLKGKNVVLFFNEGIMCYPACWNQMAAFGTDQRFNTPDLTAISVITDSPAEWQTASSKMPDLAKATILFDQSGGTGHHADPASSQSYKLGLFSMGSSMHPGQSLGHTYILVDKQGIVRDVYDDPNMGLNNDLLIQKINEFNK